MITQTNSKILESAIVQWMNQIDFVSYKIACIRDLQNGK
jgi:hypothetical protein